MSINKRLMRDTFLYATGPIFNKFIAFFLIPYYSYLLATQELGYYDLILNGSQLIVAIATLKISDSVYRWLMDSHNDITLQSVAISNSFAIIAGSILLILGINFLMPAHAVLPHKNLICLLVITVVLQAHLLQLLRGLKLLATFAFVNILNGIALLLFSVLLLSVFHLGLPGILLSLSISNTICILYVSYRIRLFGFLKIKTVNSAVLKAMVRYSFPLVYNAISWWFMGGFDRYIIAAFLGLPSNGIYAIATKFSAVVILVNSIFIPAWQDMLLKQGDIATVKLRFSKMLNLYIVLLFSLVILISSLSKIFVEQVIDPRYHEAWRYIPVLLTGNALLALTSFMGALFMMEKNTYHIFITSLLGSITNVLLTIVLIPHIALYGPGIGMAGGFLVIFLVRYFYYKKRISVQIQIRPILLLLGLFLFVMACLYFGSPLFYYAAIFITISTFIIINRQLGIALFQTISHILRRGKARRT